MRFIPVIIAVLMGHLLMAQDEDFQESEEGNVYLQGFIDLGSSASVNSTNVHALRVNFLFGAGFNDWIFIGLGPGIRINRSVRSFPVCADIRIGNRDRERAFYCAFGGGISAISRRSYEVVGPAGHGEIGIRINNKQKGGVIIFLGYEIYSAEVMEIAGSGFFSSSRYKVEDIQAVTFGIGFSF